MLDKRLNKCYNNNTKLKENSNGNPYFKIKNPA